MFKIRKKKKGAQPMEQDLQPMEGIRLTVRTMLNAAVALLRCQLILAQYGARLPEQRIPLSPLVEVILTPPLSQLVDQAKRGEFITDEEASQLLNGKVITIDKETP